MYSDQSKKYKCNYFFKKTKSKTSPDYKIN